MRRNGLKPLAFCTLWGVLLLAAAAPTPATASGSEEFARYQSMQIRWGATSLPLAAQLEYRTALEYAREGDRALAKQHLETAVALAPEFPDAYFTLARVEFASFDTDALYHFVRGVKAMAFNFRAQSLLAVNVLLMAALALMLAISVALVAFALRYLPFVAHRPAEMLGRRFRAALPRAAAYLAVSVPFVVFPGFVAGTCVLLLMTWHFMHKRERFGLTLLLAPFLLIGWFSQHLDRFAPIVDPESFTNLAAESNYAPGDVDLINALARTEVPELQADKHNALGQIYLRWGDHDSAANHFLQSIALRPGAADGYINLGNVYYRQGMWDKALEGYRKAVSVDSTDAVGQYNLAQAYIKTLLMAESSKALRMANAAGIQRVHESMAKPALDGLEVYPATFSLGDLWRIAAIEGPHAQNRPVAAALAPVLGFSPRISAWMLFVALMASVFLSRALKPRHLSFQCSNCGELTCESCGADDRGSYLCRGCHGVIAEVTSEKVVDALLRSRRQKVVVKRRKTIRSLTWWLPGMRDLFYGKIARGVATSFVFSVSVVTLWARGYVVPDWNSLDYPAAAWNWVVPAIGIALSYVASLASKGHMEMRNYRSPEARQRQGDRDDPDVARTA